MAQAFIYAKTWNPPDSTLNTCCANERLHSRRSRVSLALGAKAACNTYLLLEHTLLGVRSRNLRLGYGLGFLRLPV
jgi:hypothetical protein